MRNELMRINRYQKPDAIVSKVPDFVLIPVRFVLLKIPCLQDFVLIPVRFVLLKIPCLQRPFRQFNRASDELRRNERLRRTLRYQIEPPRTELSAGDKWEYLADKGLDCLYRAETFLKVRTRPVVKIVYVLGPPPGIVGVTRCAYQSHFVAPDESPSLTATFFAPHAMMEETHRRKCLIAELPTSGPNPHKRSGHESVPPISSSPPVSPLSRFQILECIVHSLGNQSASHVVLPDPNNAAAARDLAAFCPRLRGRMPSGSSPSYTVGRAAILCRFRSAASVGDEHSFAPLIGPQ